MKKVTVSIITPTYNHRKFIRKCIESVVSQSFQDWELIIVDDDSKDETYKIAEEYATQDRRIKLIKHAKNWGINNLAKTYNQALRLANGKYIAILEGDDFWPQSKLEKQIDCIRRHPKAVMAYGNCILTNEAGLPIKLFTYNFNKSWLDNKPRGAILNLFADLRFSIIPVTVIITARALRSIGGFRRDNYYPFVDIPTFLQLTMKGGFCYQDDILGFYRKQRNSEWFSYASKTSTMGKDDLQKSLIRFLRKNTANESVRAIINRKEIELAQAKYIQRRKKNKLVSLIVNFIAFNIDLNPLILVFFVQYLIYLIKKNKK